MKDENLTVRLADFSAFIEQQANLDDCLRELTVMAANILRVRNCSIMLLKEEESVDDVSLRVFAHSGYLPETAYGEAMKIKHGVSGYVVESGEPLLVEDIDKSRFASVKRGRYDCKDFMAAPILINGKVVGVINANTPTDRSAIDRKDLELLNIIALLISKSIQVIHLQNVLKSRYVSFALAHEKTLETRQMLLSTSQNPHTIAKILAKTFYNEMARAGFGPDHMLSTATEIISLLSDKLKKHGDRLKR